jgi:hypothetical protein
MTNILASEIVAVQIGTKNKTEIISERTVSFHYFPVICGDHFCEIAHHSGRAARDMHRLRPLVHWDRCLWVFILCLCCSVCR